MSNLSKHLQTTVPYEPLLLDALKGEDNGITEQHARILASLFKLGGYTTLNVLVSLVKFAQPTVSLRVQELENYGYLRKNPEMIPTPLVLTLNTTDLKDHLDQKATTQRNAIDFLFKIHNEGIEYSSVHDTFVKAFRILYPHDLDFADLLAYTYLHLNISSIKLLKLLNAKKKFTSKNYEELLASGNDVFHIIHKKQKKSDINIRPRLPLDKLLQHRKYYLEMVSNHYSKQLEELSTFMLSEYDSFIPHQYLNFFSEIKAKVGMCLRHYSSVKLINNGILSKKFPENNLVQLIGERKEITTKHQLFILTTEDITISEPLGQNQYKIKKIEKPTRRDYSTRDFIIFEDRGCLIIPERSESHPYYYIGPRFIKTVNDYFDSRW